MKTFSVANAANELGVSPGTVYALCASRKIRHERHGLGRGRIKIPADALEEYRQSVTVLAERKSEKSLPASPTPTPHGFEVLNAARLREAWKGHEP